MQRKEFEKRIRPQDASKLKIAVVVADFHPDITGSMLRGALEVLRKWRVSVRKTTVLHVPGSFELPLGCLKMLKKKPDAIIALGCIIKGETRHDEYLAGAVAQGLMDLVVAHGIPISFGVITPNNVKQARARAMGRTNHGTRAAVTALQSALLR